jgi:hypothetical protein
MPAAIHDLDWKKNQRSKDGMDGMIQ